MSILEPKEICEVVAVEDDGEFRVYRQGNPTGFLMVPERHGQSEGLVLKSDGGDFAKWIRRNAPTIDVRLPSANRKLVFRSGDYWLPLVFLASDVTLQVYLNLVANYLYDKMKGALTRETTRVHLSATYKDNESGIVKRFNFEGDAEALQKVVKKVDLNRFLDE